MSTYESEEIEAVQAVVDRVSSYQDGAPESTVAEELRNGLGEADVSVSHLILLHPQRILFTLRQG